MPIMAVRAAMRRPKHGFGAVDQRQVFLDALRMPQEHGAQLAGDEEILDARAEAGLFEQGLDQRPVAPGVEAAAAVEGAHRAAAAVERDEAPGGQGDAVLVRHEEA